MKAHHFMDELNSDPDSPDVEQSLRVVIAYNDVAAGKRAMRVMGNLRPRFGDAIAFRLLPWSFDLLTDTGWSEAAARDADEADMLFIATSSIHPLPSAIEQWVETAISRKRGTAAAVIALFGPKENPDGAGSPRLETIQAAVHRAGLDFFAPAPHHELDEAIVRIHQSAGTTTPVFDETLHHNPRPHRDQNTSPP